MGSKKDVWEHVKEMVKEVQIVLCLYILFAKKKRFLEPCVCLFLRTDSDRIDAIP